MNSPLTTKAVGETASPSFQPISEEALSRAFDSARTLILIHGGPIHVFQWAEGFVDTDRYSLYEFLITDRNLPRLDESCQRLVATVKEDGTAVRVEGLV